MLINTVMNDKKTSYCRGTVWVKFKFLYHLLSRNVFWETGLWIQSQLMLLGFMTSCCAGEGICRGLRETQTISRAFRQEHCAGLSSRGCLAGSSRLRGLRGFISCQMTCPVLPGWKGPFLRQTFLTLPYSVCSGCSVFKCCVLPLFSQPLFLHLFLTFPKVVLKLYTEKMNSAASDVGRERYNDTNCRKSARFQEK